MDDDGETIAVLGAGRIAALNTTALAWQAEVRHSSNSQRALRLLIPRYESGPTMDSLKVRVFYSQTFWFMSVSLLQEPPEDEANIIEKIISVRTKNKEVKTKHTCTARLYQYL